MACSISFLRTRLMALSANSPDLCFSSISSCPLRSFMISFSRCSSSTLNCNCCSRNCCSCSRIWRSCSFFTRFSSFSAFSFMRFISIRPNITTATIYIMYAHHVSYHAGSTLMLMDVSRSVPSMRLRAFTWKMYVPLLSCVYSFVVPSCGPTHCLS